jgi:hypothetical protein
VKSKTRNQLMAKSTILIQLTKDSTNLYPKVLEKKFSTERTRKKLRSSKKLRPSDASNSIKKVNREIGVNSYLNLISQKFPTIFPACTLLIPLVLQKLCSTSMQMLKISIWLKNCSTTCGYRSESI